MRNHTNTYVPNGNLTYESVSRKQYDCSMTPCITERHLSWDCKDRLHGISDNGEEDSVASMYGWFGVPYEVRHANSRGRGAHMYFPITRTDSEGNTVETSGEGSQRSHPDTLGEGPVYFYHRDHLGSTMSVTDSLGNTIQQVEYTPWGEVFVEQRSGNSDFSTPYLFNGKELDEETGLYYYGARYYDPKMSVWYSTDPMQMDYPWVSTYGYCLGNPINSLDSEGNRVIFINGYYNTGILSALTGQYGGEKYWGTSFVNAGMNYFGESSKTPYFIDGRGKWNSSGIERFNAGVKYAKTHFSELISGLAEGEPINFVSHSMGSAYAEGMISYFISQNVKIGEVIHLSSADSSDFKTNSPNTYQLQYEYDPILLYKNFGENDLIQGVKRFGIIKYDGSISYSHGKSKFDANTWNALKDLKSIKLLYKENVNNYFYGQYSFIIPEGVYTTGSTSNTEFKFLYINGSYYSHKTNNDYYGPPK